MTGFVPFLCPASCVKFWTRTACAAMLMPGLCTHTALTLSVLILGLCMCIHVQPVQFVVCAISTAGTTELKSNTINVFLEVQMWDHVFANLVIRILFVLIFWCNFLPFLHVSGHSCVAWYWCMRKHCKLRLLSQVNYWLSWDHFASSVYCSKMSQKYWH